MIKHYVLISLRNMWKRKTFTVIHTLGLSIAFAVALVLFLTAMFEESYDNFHTNGDRIFQIYRQQQRPQGTEYDTPMPVPFAPAAKAEISGIQRVSRFGESESTLRLGEKVLDGTVKYVDPDFLEMFSFPLLSGNAGQALNATGNVIITSSFAEKLFGTKNVTGRALEINTGSGWKNVLISAVAHDIPLNSSIKFDILSRFENFPGYAGNEDKWDNQNHPVFIQLKEKLSPETIGKAAVPFIKKYFADQIKMLKRDGAQPDANGNLISLKLIPIEKIHFSQISNLGGSINPFFPWILILLSGVILFIAGSNFVNLSLAAAFTRAREIGVRKTFGAQKRQLVIQFWSEAFIICLFSLFVGAGLVLAGQKVYIAVTASQMSASQLLTAKAILLFTLLFLLTTLLAGGYPSWVMARFNTIKTLQGKMEIGSGNRLRNMLTGMQFFISVVLITSTLIIIRQLHYMRNKPLGYNKTQVISIPIGIGIEPESALLRMRQKLEENPNVLAMTGTDLNLGVGLDGSSSTSIMGFDYKNREIKTNWLRVDYDYLKTLDIPLLAGRDFSHDFTTDTASALINERMALLLGEKNPVGSILPLGEGHRLKVIGVVKDFNFKNLHQQIKPLTMVIKPGEWPLSYIFVKVQPRNLPRSMNDVKKAWKEINPGNKVDPSFLDENVANEYKKEERLSRIFTAGAVLAIFISCLGLFATSLLSIRQRTKEIGIRKVLGADVSGIVLMLSKDFAVLVATAFLAGAPLTWFIMNKWLDDFAYHITISVWIMLFGGIIVLLIALLTVSFHSVKAALANPVKSLRTE